jgi:hypothetical protein
VLGLALGLAVLGCDDKPRPWSGRDGRDTPAAVLAPPSAGSPQSPSTSDSLRLAPRPDDSETAPPADPNKNANPGSYAGSNPAGDTAAAPTTAPAAPGPSGTTAPAAAADDAIELPNGATITPGGLWVKCAAGLALSADPLKDVTRLGVVCGPSNGMRRKTPQPIVGVLGEHEPPVTAELRVSRGACYRIIGVADPGVAELDVTVRSSHDVAVAGDHSSGRLAMVQPDRPFCALADDAATIEIRAARGSGRFAAEVWAIGEPRKKGNLEGEPADETPLDNP